MPSGRAWNQFLHFTVQAGLCGWSLAQEKQVVRGFLSLRRDSITSRETTCSGATAEGILKSALLLENGAQSATSLSKQLSNSSYSGNPINSGQS